MTAAVEILAPSHSDEMKVAFEGIVNTRIVDTPSNARRSRILVGWMSDLGNSERRSELERLFALALQKSVDMPFVLIDSKSRVLKNHATLETLIRWATLPGFYLAPDLDSVRRMAMARFADAEDKLIASATIIDGKLTVWSCEPKRYRVAVSEIPALAEISPTDLLKFEISTSGSRIHWPKGDIDLGLDTIRYYADPDAKKEQDCARRTAVARYSKAIRSFRDEKGIRQTEIEGLTERQVRRIESGESIPQTKSLKKLAAAHGLSVDEYLDELAKRSKRN